MKNIILLFLTIFCFLLSPQRLQAQSDEARVQMIYQLANQMNLDNSKESITIGILERKLIYSIINQRSTSYKINGRSIKPIFFKFNYQVQPVDILYVSYESSANTFFDVILKKTKGTKTLIITESDGLLDEGSHINLSYENGQYVYRINENNLRAVGLSPTAQLMQGAAPPLNTKEEDKTENTVSEKQADKEGNKLKEKVSEIKEDRKTRKQEKNKKEDSEDKNTTEKEKPPVAARFKDAEEQEQFIGKVASSKEKNDDIVKILRNYIASLERKLDENKIDYLNLKSQYQEEQAEVEAEIEELNLTIIEKDSLRAKEQLLADRKIALIESEKQLAEAKARQNLYLALFAGSLALGLFVALLIFYRDRIIINRQKNALSESLGEIHQQKEEIEAQRDEIERQKNTLEIEQQESEKLLLNILPAQTAQELKSTGKATPQAYSLASVLFTDFKGFTNIAETMSPEELVGELNICFTAFDEIIEKHGMERIKTIGDAYMCVGGLPNANTSNPLDAVKAGIEIQEFMQKLKEEKTKEGKPYFECRLGIHSGKVVAGVVGKKKFAYDIWGDTVNLASRLETYGEVGKVNISEQTRELVETEFKFEKRGVVNVKGKGDVEMFFVKS